MLINMFTIFDPILFNLPLNYFLILFLLMFFIKMMIWLNNKNSLNLLNYNFYKETLSMNCIMNKSNHIIFSSLINLLIIFNLMNLFPNFFYISSNIMYTLNLSLYFIFNFLLFNLYNNKNIFFMNLTPKNTPLYLIFLINFIELNSFFIQIITLSLRLMINMMLGHIILILLNKIIFIEIYMIMEFLIICIQSYVFFILILLNFNNMF